MDAIAISHRVRQPTPGCSCYCARFWLDDEGEIISMRVLCALIGLCLTAGCSTDNETPSPSLRLTALRHTSQLLEVDPDRAILSAHQHNGLTYLAGGSTGSESGVVYRFDGIDFTQEPIPAGPSLWWIWGNRTGQLWACGDGGRILHRTENEVWQTQEVPIDDNTILYGIWGDDNGVLYAVGGSYRLGGEQNILLTSDGQGSWTRVNVPSPPEPFTFFKVWGHNPTWIVGDLGWTVRVGPDETTYTQSDTGEVIFTVHGHEDEVFAVGGLTTGEIYGLQTGIMIRQQLGPVPALNGIFIRPDGWRLAAGEGGQVLLGSKTSAWESTVLFPSALADRTIHAVASRTRTVFAGGDLRRMNRGFIILTPDFNDEQGNPL